MQTETSTSNFLDDLLADAEIKEEKQTAAYYDLLIAEVAKLESEIAANFTECDKEVEVIKGWTLKRNSALQERNNLLRLKLESFLRAENKKTIELPRGTLKMRRQQDKIEISNMEVFLANANSLMVTVVPEQIKASLSGIKAFYKMTTKIPAGVTVIEGEDRFSLTIRNTISTEEETE